MALWNDLHIWIGSLRERLIMILASGSLLNFTKFEIIFPKHLGDQLQMAPLIRCLITTHLTKGEAPPLPEDLDKPFLIAQRPGASLLLQEAGAKGPQPRPRESVETTLHRMLCVERHAKPVRTQKTDFPRESQKEREGLLGGGVLFVAAILASLGCVHRIRDSRAPGWGHEGVRGVVVPAARKRLSLATPPWVTHVRPVPGSLPWSPAAPGPALPTV